METNNAAQIRFTDASGRFEAVRESRGLWTVRATTKLYGESYTAKTAALAALAAMAARNPVETVGAMRARIARAVDDPNTAARDLAALTKRLGEVVRDIEAIDAREAQESTGEAVADGEFDASAI